MVVGNLLLSKRLTDGVLLCIIVCMIKIKLWEIGVLIGFIVYIVLSLINYLIA